MEHSVYMRRCLDLARQGLGDTYPNPMVGAVLVYEDTIIGEGYHREAGGPHAEVRAIQNVPQKWQSYISKSTLYVNLEPCNIHGKTPPCTELILSHEISNVVIGCLDPNEKVSGKGIQQLKEASINVRSGVCLEDCQQLNKRFLTFHKEKRPYVILKWAQTQDGYIARPDYNSKWISNEWSRQMVHKWRGEEEAIMVGSHTVLQDNPSLTVRHWYGPNPTRLILNQEHELPKGSNIFKGEEPVWILNPDREEENGLTHYRVIDFSGNIAKQVLEILYENQIQSLFVEGGRQTLQTFIDEELWDEIRLFTSPQTFGKGIQAPNFNGQLVAQTAIRGDQLNLYKPGP